MTSSTSSPPSGSRRAARPSPFRAGAPRPVPPVLQRCDQLGADALVAQQRPARLVPGRRGEVRRRRSVAAGIVRTARCRPSRTACTGGGGAGRARPSTGGVGQWWSGGRTAQRTDRRTGPRGTHRNSVRRGILRQDSQGRRGQEGQGARWSGARDRWRSSPRSRRSPTTACVPRPTSSAPASTTARTSTIC